MSVELESAKRLTALKNKIDAKTETPSNTLSESVDNIIAGYGQGGTSGVDNTVEDAILDNSLTGTYTNNRIKRIAPNRLRACNIVILNSTSIEEIASYGFYQSTKLEECNTPNLQKLTDGFAFSGCRALERVDFPNVSGVVGGSTFNGCSALTYANLGNATQLGTSCFSGATNLKALVLPKTNGITALNNVNVFSGSAIANGTGFVYVPDVDAYKNATNWSTYADQIKPLSELPEGGII